MAKPQCSIVPSYLLKAISENHKDKDVSQAAANTLGVLQDTHKARQQHFEARIAQLHSSSGASRESTTQSQQSIVPHYLLEHISNAEGVDDAVKETARNTLEISRQVQEARVAGADIAGQNKSAKPVWRGVYDMKNQEEKDAHGKSLLPGKPARVEGQPASTDKAVNEAFDNCGKVLQFYREKFNYNSVDNHGMAIISSVHVGNKYGNASWDPDNQQMIYGDGDGVFLYNFTACLDVIGHEMTHAVTEKNSHLEYNEESGALNEHISDAFGIMVRQYAENKTARQSDWLIGENCLFPGVKGVALRDMKHPGTAYNNPENENIGKDPQPADFKEMEAYKAANPSWKDEDEGGVHIFSGIPNRAFVLCAEAFDGYSWEKAGKIWWTTVTTNRISPRCTFIQFADATVDVAHELFGDAAATTVRNAWNEVGIVRKH